MDHFDLRHPGIFPVFMKWTEGFSNIFDKELEE